MIFMILVYPLRFSVEHYFRKLSENWKIMKKQKNEENHGFYDFWWFLHILGIFADFQQNGKFYEIRYLQLKLPTKLWVLEHLFINPIFGLKTIKIVILRYFMDFSVFLRKRWNPAKSGIRGYLPTISWFLGVFLKIIGLSEAHRPWEVLSRIELRQEKYGAQGILPWGV